MLSSLVCPNEELYRTKILGLSVDQSRLGAAHRMRAVDRWVKPDVRNPPSTSRAYCLVERCGEQLHSAGEQIVAAPKVCCIAPLGDRFTGLGGDLELNRLPCLLLHDDRA